MNLKNRLTNYGGTTPAIIDAHCKIIRRWLLSNKETWPPVGDNQAIFRSLLFDLEEEPREEPQEPAPKPTTLYEIYRPSPKPKN